MHRSGSRTCPEPGSRRARAEQSRQAVTIVECRPPWREDYGPEWTRMRIARLRYVGSTRLWTLYYHRHTGLGSATRCSARLVGSTSSSMRSSATRSASSGAQDRTARPRRLRGWPSWAALRSDLAAGAYLVERWAGAIVSAVTVAERYADTGLGLADASLVALVERLGTIDMPRSTSGTSEPRGP